MATRNRPTQRRVAGVLYDPTAQDMAEKEPLLCSLGAIVQEDFLRLKQFRSSSGLDAELDKCVLQRKGEYQPSEMANMGSITTFMNVTSTKCRAGEAWLDDILASTKEFPLTIQTTPIPTVPPFVRDMIIEQLKGEIQEFGVPPEDVEQYLRTKAAELRDLAKEVLAKRATDGADKMMELIKDQLLECDFKGEFSKFRTDLMTFPYSVMGGPFAENRKQLTWVGRAKTPQVQTRPQLTVRRISPYDFYFEGTSSTPNDGACIEIMQMRPRDLFDCIGMPFYDEEKIRYVLETYPSGYTIHRASDEQRVLNGGLGLRSARGSTLDVMNYWGNIQGRDLKAFNGYDELDDDKYYDVNLMVVDGVCIKAILNPDPMGKVPFYVTAYEKIPGAMAGRSPPMLMRPQQDVINSAYRALRRNMGISAGVFAEVQAHRLADGQAPEEILPNMVKVVTEDLTGSNSNAYKFHQIKSYSTELNAVIQAELKHTDDATGIPAYSYGNAATSGAGRTVGGLAMLMGNASKGIKKVISNIESDVLEPLGQAMFNYNMLFDADDAIKVDAQIVARGPTGIVMREAMLQRRIEGLQMITPYAVMPNMIEPNGMKIMLREILKGLELPVDDIIPDPKRVKQLQSVAQGIQGEAPAGPGGPGGGQTNTSEGFQPENLQGTVPAPAGRGIMATKPGQPGDGTVPTAVLDGRTGATRQAMAVANRVI